MNLDQETVSLKILKILYHFQKQNQGSGVDEKTISERFDSYDLDKLKSIIQKSITELIKAKLVDEKKDNNKLLYSITEKGINQYQRFKQMLDDDSVNTPNSNISIAGNWNGDNQLHHHYYATNLLRGASVEFPSDNEEFIAHYSELMGLLEKCEKNVMDGMTNEKGGKVLEHLSEMKVIINQDSTIMGGRLRLMEKMIEQLKIIIDHSLVNMTKESKKKYEESSDF